MGNILIKILFKDTNNILTSKNSKKLIKGNLYDKRNKNIVGYENSPSISKDYIKISKEDKFSILDI